MDNGGGPSEQWNKEKIHMYEYSVAALGNGNILEPVIREDESTRGPTKAHRRRIIERDHDHLPKNNTSFTGTLNAPAQRL